MLFYESGWISGVLTGHAEPQDVDPLHFAGLRNFYSILCHFFNCNCEHRGKKSTREPVEIKVGRSYHILGHDQIRKYRGLLIVILRIS